MTLRCLPVVPVLLLVAACGHQGGSGNSTTDGGTTATSSRTAGNDRGGASTTRQSSATSAGSSPNTGGTSTSGSRDASANGGTSASANGGTSSTASGGTSTSAIVGTVCQPNATRCVDVTTLGTCNSTGTAESTASCLYNGGNCAVSGTVASCRHVFCVPGSLNCGGDGDILANINKSRACAPDGQGYVPLADCTDSGQGCFNGLCQPITCTPSERKCVGTQVLECALTGAGWNLITTCNDAEFCDSSVKAACVTKPCLVGQSGCAGNAVAACNATGSAFASATTDCGARTCMAGACLDSTFFEGFEDWANTRWATVAKYSGVRVETGSKIGPSVLVVAPELTGGQYFDGVYYAFPAPVKPTTVSFWTSVWGTFGQPWFVLSASDVTTHGLTGVTPIGSPSQVSVYVTSQSLVVANNGNSVALIDSSTQNYLTDQLLHVRLVFDWAGRKVSPYFSQRGRDGVETPPVAGTPLSLAAEVTSIACIDLFAKQTTKSGAYAVFDNIEFFQ